MNDHICQQGCVPLMEIPHILRLFDSLAKLRAWALEVLNSVHDVDRGSDSFITEFYLRCGLSDE
jgi:hypothetical protein